MATTPRICINGTGRLGREIIRQVLTASGEFEIGLINDPQMSASQLVYLLKYDSIYLGRNNPFHDGHTLEADTDNNYIIIDGKQYEFKHENDITQLPLGGLGTTHVLECSGTFKTKDQLQLFINAGAQHVICPYYLSDTTIPIYVDGVNTVVSSTEIYSLGDPQIIALSNILKPINDNYGIVSTNTNALLCYNNTMNIMDWPSTDNTNLLDYNKAAAQNMIPSNSKTPFKIVGNRVIQELNGKMAGNLCYTGVPFGNLLYITIKTRNSTAMEEINNLIKSSSSSASWDKFGTGPVYVGDDLITPIDVCGNKAQVFYLAPYSAATAEENTFTLVCTYDETASLAAYALYMAASYS